MAGVNPKIASLPVVVLALAAAQFGWILLAISELSAIGGPRIDRGLRSFVLIGVLWAAVAGADLILHPRMRMTRLVAGDAFKTALLIVVFHAVFVVGEALFGMSLSSPTNRMASLGLSFVTFWALTSLWGLVREWRKPTVQPADAEAIEGSQVRQT